MRGLSSRAHAHLIGRRDPGSVHPSHPRTYALTDPDLATVAVLLGRRVPAPLTAALSSVGVEVEQARIAQVTWRPGSSITVRYQARLSGAVSGVHQVVAASGRIPAGALVVGDGESEVGVWRVPHDPALPGLARALDPPSLAGLLSDLGLPAAGVETRLRAYRPGRRAVVEARSNGASIFLKLVPPAAAGGLHETHRELSTRLPVPRSLGFSSELGLVALEALPGTTLRRALGDPAATLPSPDEVVSIGSHLPGSDRTVRSPLERFGGAVELLKLIVPEDAGVLDDLVDRLGTEARPASTAVHGDLHEGQLLISDGRVRGVLDVDTHGIGREADDPATMIGHLSVLERSVGRSGRVAGYGSSLLACWDRLVDPVDLRLRAAAVVVGLATGPFRVQQRDWPTETRSRIRLAARWAESAAAAHEKGLTTASRPSHGHSSS
jgi:hypothetical protein